MNREERAESPAVKDAMDEEKRVLQARVRRSVASNDFETAVHDAVQRLRAELMRRGSGSSSSSGVSIARSAPR